MDIDLDTPLGPDRVYVRVGADGPCIKGRGKVALFPTVHVIFGKESNEAVTLMTTRHWPYPEKVFIRWQDNEYATKPGKSKKWLALVEPGKEHEPWVRYRTPEKDRELFERLVQQWSAWYLRVEIQTFGFRDFMVAVRDGVAEPSRLFSENKGAPEGALKFDRAGFIADYLTRAKKDIATHRMLALIKDDLPMNERLAKAQESLEKVANKQADIMEAACGPMPWTLEEPKPSSYYRIEKDDHKLIVEKYLSVIKYVRDQRAVYAKQKNLRPKTPLDQLIVPEEKVLWRYEQFELAMRRAHIFELTYESYERIYQAADVYTTEQVAGMKHHGFGVDRYVPEEEAQEHVRLISEAGYDAPFPERLPFESCWLAIGRGRLGLSPEQAYARGLKNSFDGLEYRLVGFLVTDAGFCVEVVETFDKERGRTKFDFIPHHEPKHWPTREVVQYDDRTIEAGNWYFPYALTPWLILYMIEAINDHHTTIVNGAIGMSERMLYERQSKKLGMQKPIPSPYYTVTMRDITIKLAARRINRRNKLKWSFSHRFDRRGCESMNVERGPLPMPEDVKLLLRRRTGYQIFDGPEPITDEVLLDKLRKRRIMPKTHLEWMAIKTWWRDGTIVGDPNLPYVPSTRKPSKGMVGYKDTPATKREMEVEFPSDNNESPRSSTG